MSRSLPYTFSLALFVFMALVGLPPALANAYNGPLTNNFELNSVPQKVIRGTVLDAETGQPLAGASILVLGANLGTFTDDQGEFQLTVPDERNIFVVTFIGYEAQEIEIGTQTVFTIRLVQDVTSLKEVVIVGYGTQETYKVSAAIQQITSEDLQIDRRPVSTLESSLVGSLPGLVLNQSSGQLGAGVGLQVRAASALASKNALILVDGFESSIQNLNPSDIASVTILKDAAATAIYGARGANGVVLITTKSPQRNEALAVIFNSNFSFQNPASTADMVNSQQFMEAFNRAEFADRQRIFPNLTPDDFDFTYSEEDIARAASGFYPETNWAEELYNETAVQSLQNLGIQGGSERIGYFLNFGYLSQNGVAQGNDQLQRYSLRAKVDADINEWLSTGVNIFNAFRDLDNVPISTNNGLRGQPFFPVQLDTGQFAGTYVFKGSTSGEENPIAQVNSGSFDRTLSDELNLQLYATIKPFQAFAIEGRVSYVRNNNNRSQWNNPYEYLLLDEEDLSSTGTPVPFTINDRRLTETSSRSFAINTLLTANYAPTFGEAHNLDILIGTQTQQGQRQSISATRFGYILPNLQSLNLGTQINGFGNSSSGANDRSTLSYFSRVAYDYIGRYLVEFSFRADASSNFVRDRWGFFPAVSAGWNMHGESFLKDLSALNVLKVRASWGINGDDGSLTGIELVSTNPAGVAFGGSVQPTILLNRPKNPDLTWETSQKANIGLDVVLWNGKLSFNGDYFIDSRQDIIATVLTSAEGGLNGILANVYDARAWGWEFTLGHKSQIRQIGITADLNLSYYNNEITQGAGDAPLNISAENYQIEGFPTVNWFGYQTDGYFQSQADIDNWVNSAGQAIDQATVVSQGAAGKYIGGYRYVDQLTEDTNGDGIPDAPDGIINADDRVILRENAVDNYRLGGSIGLSYQGFTLSARIYGVLQSHEWLNDGNNLNAFTSSGVAPFRYQIENWTPETPDALFSQAYAVTRPYNPDVSDLIVERDFIKFKNVNLAYAFSQSAVSKLSIIRGLELYASFENLGILWTNYPLFQYGFDPEFGADGFNYPLAIKSSFGANITF